MKNHQATKTALWEIRVVNQTRKACSVWGNCPQERGKCFWTACTQTDTLAEYHSAGKCTPLIKYLWIDFTNEQVDRYFRPCTADPNRTGVFVSYHGGNACHPPNITTWQKSEGDRKRLKGVVNCKNLSCHRRLRPKSTTVNSNGSYNIALIGFSMPLPPFRRGYNNSSKYVC